MGATQAGDLPLLHSQYLRLQGVIAMALPGAIASDGLANTLGGSQCFVDPWRQHVVLFHVQFVAFYSSSATHDSVPVQPWLHKQGVTK